MKKAVPVLMMRAHHLLHIMLPTIAMWSSICLGTLDCFSKEYKKHSQPIVQTYFTQNLTTVEVEQFFWIEEA